MVGVGLPTRKASPLLNAAIPKVVDNPLPPDNSGLMTKREFFQRRSAPYSVVVMVVAFSSPVVWLFVPVYFALNEGLYCVTVVS